METETKVVDTSAPELRKTGLGASDAAAVVGVSKYRTPLDVYLEKRGLLEQEETSEPAYWGNRLEHIVLEEYARRAERYVLGVHPLHGPVVFAPDGLPIVETSGVDWQELLGTLRHPEFPWLMCHLDGWELNDDRRTPIRPVQAKTAGAWVAREWGEEGTDEAPPEYIVQEQHEGMIVEALFGIVLPIPVPVLFGGQRFATYEIPPDAEFQGDILSLEQELWERIQRGDPPSAEPTEAGKRALARLYPKDERGELVGDLEAMNLVARLQIARQNRDDADTHVLEAEHRLKELMKEHGALLTSGGKIYWRNQKDREVTDFKAAFTELWNAAALGRDLAPGDRDAILAKHTTTRPGPRVFRPYFKKESA